MATLIRFYALLCFCVFLSLLLSQPLKAQNTSLQTLPELGNEICSIMLSNPGELLDVVPVYFISQLALINELGGSAGLNDFLFSADMSMNEAVEMVAEDSGMLDADAGEQFFGNEPVEFCNWVEPVETSCNTMFSNLSSTGLMVGTISATVDAISSTAQDYNLQACGNITINTSDESIRLDLFQLDGYWYMVNLTELNGAAPVSNTSTSMDYSSPSRYGDISLGNFRSPHVVAVIAGGSTAAADILDAPCTGYVATEGPDVQLEYSGNSKVLNIYVNGSVDTTLIINAPDGSWHCNDDYGRNSGTNPGIQFSPAANGIYDIWVGAYFESGTGTSVELKISEAEMSW